MAYKKKTPTVIDEEELEITEEPEDETIEEKEEKKVSVKKEYKDNDYIMCHSVIAGGLKINCRSQEKYVFKDYGSKCEIKYRDLIDLIHKHSDHIFVPRIIIDDENIVNEFSELKNLYETMYTEGDFRDILKLPPEQIKSVVDTLPEGLIPTLRSLAASMVSSGEIDSVRTIRALTDIFGSDFTLLSELFGK